MSTPTPAPEHESHNLTPSGSLKRPLIEEELMKTGRVKSSKQHPGVFHGKHFARYYEMFAHVSTVINEGIEYTGLEENDPNSVIINHGHMADHLYTAFQGLCKAMPTMVDVLLDNLTDSKDLVKAIQLGAGTTQNDDTGGLKGAIITDFLASELHQLQSGTATINDSPISGSHWGNFCYSGTYNPKAPLVGALKSPMLIWAAKYIFLRPMSASDDVDDNKSTRSGNATLHGMTSVSGAAIAYVATQVLFALSSGSTFKPTSPTCKCEQFYESIQDFFNDPDIEEEAQDILEYWNLQLFPKRSRMTTDTVNHQLELFRAAKAAVHATTNEVQ
ncbi:hypothetical protein ABKN59_011436 [Abortiporus biennis]